MSAVPLPYLWRPPERSAPRIVFGQSSDEVEIESLKARFGLDGNARLEEPLRFDAAFSAGECAEILALVAGLTRSPGGSTALDPGYRQCEVAWLEQSPSCAWVYDRIRDLATAANQQYRFSVAGFTEPLVAVRYLEGGRFDWHTDLGPGPMSTRKISLCVQLSDAAGYDGGDLEYCPHGAARGFRGVGNAAVFPAYIAHRITPVTRGTRHALVAWIHGNAFT